MQCITSCKGDDSEMECITSCKGGDLTQHDRPSIIDAMSTNHKCEEDNVIKLK